MQVSLHVNVLTLLPLLPLTLPPSLSAAESRESGYESGILVSKAVDLNIDRVNLKPAGEWTEPSTFP